MLLLVSCAVMTNHRKVTARMHQIMFKSCLEPVEIDISRTRDEMDSRRVGLKDRHLEMPCPTSGWEQPATESRVCLEVVSLIC